MSQVSSKRLAGALENAGVVIAFALARESAEVMARELSGVDPLKQKELPPTPHQHSLYYTVHEQMEGLIESLQALKPRYCYVRVLHKKARRIKISRVPDVKVDKGEMEEVLAEYRRRYQRNREEAEAAIARIPLPSLSPTSLWGRRIAQR